MGTILGANAAWKRGIWLGYGVLSLAIVFSAVPSFWFALILLLASGYYWPVLPLTGMTDRNVQAGGALLFGTWWWVVFPGAALFVTALGFMLVGLALEEAFNPYLVKGSRRH